MENYEQIKDSIELMVKKEIDNRKSHKESFITTLIIINFGLMGLIFAVMSFFGIWHFDMKIKENVSNEFDPRIKEIDKRIETERLKHTHEINSLLQQNTAISKEMKAMYLDIKRQSPDWDKNVEKIINEQTKKSLNKELYHFYIHKGVKEYINNNSEAIKSFKTALKYKPDDMDVLYKLARAYKDIEKNDQDARNYLGQAIENGFKDKERAKKDGFKKLLGEDIFGELFQKS